MVNWLNVRILKSMQKSVICKTIYEREKIAIFFYLRWQQKCKPWSSYLGLCHIGTMSLKSDVKKVWNDVWSSEMETEFPSIHSNRKKNHLMVNGNEFWWVSVVRLIEACISCVAMLFTSLIHGRLMNVFFLTFFKHYVNM